MDGWNEEGFIYTQDHLLKFQLFDVLIRAQAAACSSGSSNYRDVNDRGYFIGSRKKWKELRDRREQSFVREYR